MTEPTRIHRHRWVCNDGWTEGTRRASRGRGRGDLHRRVEALTRQETVKHSEEQWGVGDVHTNSIDGVWSLFKRSIIATLHKISGKHMDCYLEELEWRFNNRDNFHIFRDTLKRIVNTGKLTYRKLARISHRVAGHQLGKCLPIASCSAFWGAFRVRTALGAPGIV